MTPLYFYLAVVFHSPEPDPYKAPPELWWVPFLTLIVLVVLVNVVLWHDIYCDKDEDDDCYYPPD